MAAGISPEENIEWPWTVLADKPLLDGADLALLNNGYEQLCLAQLDSVVERVSLALPAATLDICRARLAEARYQRSRRNRL